MLPPRVAVTRAMPSRCAFVGVVRTLRLVFVAELFTGRRALLHVSLVLPSALKEYHLLPLLNDKPFVYSLSTSTAVLRIPVALRKGVGHVLRL